MVKGAAIGRYPLRRSPKMVVDRTSGHRGLRAESCKAGGKQCEAHLPE